MAGDNWKLPKPIFRTSEGSTVAVEPLTEHAEIAEFETHEPETAENLSSLYLPPDSSASLESPSAPPIVVEEQPNISEQLTAERIVPVLPATERPAKKSGSSFLSILLVLFFILAALISVLFYVFFIRQPADTTF